MTDYDNWKLKAPECAEPRFCKNCGAEIKPRDDFCMDCLEAKRDSLLDRVIIQCDVTRHGLQEIIDELEKGADNGR